jgi:hypothetical protein
MNNHNNDERIARVEGVMERVLYEVADLKVDVRTTRTELQKEIQETRSESRHDFRFLLGAQLTTALALVAVMAKVFGWV